MSADPVAEQSPFLSGIVLAAGASTRLGRPKQLLPFGDRCLLQRVIDEAAHSRLHEIVVVLGHRAAEIRRALRLPGRARIVVNSDHVAGQGASLAAGLCAADARATAAAVLLGDQPGVSAALIDRVVEAFLAGHTPAARPVYVGTDRRVPGHPVLLARRVWPEVVPRVVHPGAQPGASEGARSALAAHPEWLLEVVLDGEPPADIDTWEDYRRSIDALPRID